MSYITNPFQNLDLEIPETLRPEVERFCQTQPSGGAKPSPDDSPFDRYIDIWFFAVCVGARRGKGPKVKNSHRFITGEILSRDPYRIELLELLAIADSTNPWILENPAGIIDLANNLAAVGLPEVVEMLNDGTAKPIWNLTDSIIGLLPEPN
ncbi:MAG: hypothetical protein HYX79_00675 [Chloroflexi bacterium]|nr:hypothetical protein [Chloroflexota bacterium]